jgi:hypothetical protein
MVPDPLTPFLPIKNTLLTSPMENSFNISMTVSNTFCSLFKGSQRIAALITEQVEVCDGHIA